MKYSEAKPKIKSGDLLAWSHKKWGSWYDFQIQMVRAFTQSDYCHVGIAWCIAGRTFVIEAVGSGVRIFPLSHAESFYWVPLPVEWSEKVEEFALSTIGEPYSKIECFKAFFGMELEETKERTWECAELAMAILGQAGCKLNVSPTPSKVVQAALEKGNSLCFVEV